jgi:hypothetical protein
MKRVRLSIYLIPLLTVLVYSHYVLLIYTIPRSTLPSYLSIYMNMKRKYVQYTGRQSTTASAATPNPSPQPDSRARSRPETASSRHSTAPSRRAALRAAAHAASARCSRRGGFGRRICRHDFSIAYIIRSRLSEGQGAYCEQKANLIGTQLVILVNRPWIIGQSTALRSPPRTCSRSSSVSAPGIRSALYRYGRPMWNLAIMYRPRSMASATAVAGECGRGGGGGGSRGRVVGMGDVVDAAGVVVVVVEGDECAAGTGSVSVN